VIGVDASMLLSMWEANATAPLLRRALGLLTLAWPERRPEQWADVPIGERDERLLVLHEELFGGRFDATAACPSCGERVEFAFTTRDVRVVPERAASDGNDLRVESQGYRVAFRLPNTADLLTVAASPSDDPRGVLLERCILTATRRGTPVAASELPDTVRDAIDERMAAEDPQADVTFSLTCPSCAHTWTLLFDVVSYLWSEVDDWAERTLLDVHRLASAYGWSEPEILSMNARRRRVYLDFVGA
jgi:hypothetical protein